MGTAPPAVLSWQPRSVSPFHSNADKFHKPSKRHQHSRHLRVNSVGLAVRRACLAKWGSQGHRRYRERAPEKLKDGISSPLDADHLNLSKPWKSSGLPELVRRKVHQHSYVCCAADSGAFFSEDLGLNGAYDSKGGYTFFLPFLRLCVVGL